jgi:hypothetical protein
MHTEFWKGLAAFGVRRFGEKKPIEFGSETQIQKRKKGEEECLRVMIFIERDLIPKEDKGAYNHV